MDPIHVSCCGRCQSVLFQLIREFLIYQSDCEAGRNGVPSIVVPSSSPINFSLRPPRLRREEAFLPDPHDVASAEEAHSWHVLDQEEDPECIFCQETERNGIDYSGSDDHPDRRHNNGY